MDWSGTFLLSDLLVTDFAFFLMQTIFYGGRVIQFLPFTEIEHFFCIYLHKVLTFFYVFKRCAGF